MNLLDNMFLFCSVIIGTILTIPTCYIPGVYDRVFKQAPIGIEWSIIIVILVVYMILVELYKLIKRNILPPLYQTDNVNISLSNINVENK